VKLSWIYVAAVKSFLGFEKTMKSSVIRT